MHDLDAVAARRSSRPAPRRPRAAPARRDLAAVARPRRAPARARTARSRRRASCRARSPRAPPRRDTRRSVTGSSRASSSSRTCSRSSLLPGEPQRRQQPEADRLAVAVARVAGDGLDRVPDRVPEVQHLAAPGVALVRGDDRELRARAREDRRARRPRAPAATRLPQRAAGDQRRLQHLDPARRQLRRGQRRERVRVDEHARRLVVGADVVLRLRAGRRRSCRRRRSRPARRASSGTCTTGTPRW